METRQPYLYMNPDLPLDERVTDLISHLTLEEKIGLMPTRQEAVPRLHIREYSVGGEAAHGLVARDGTSTVFPQTIGLSATWDPDLMFDIGNVIGDEARAYYRKRDGLNGLTLWAPTVDMERDPRWGRTEEAYGEDPCLTGRMSTALVKGMQGSHPFYIKLVPALKHFYANNNEKDRLKSNSSIDPRNKREYYLKAFEPAVREGGIHSLMTAYNSINGTPAIAHPDVNGILKDEWKLDGYVVCDGADMHQTVDDHQYCNTYAEAVALAIRGGIDCVTDDPTLVKTSIREALEQGLLTEEDLNQALHRVFRIRFRLGQFDPDERNPYARIPETVIYSPEHRRLALRAAREAMVLLKNEKETLPLPKNSVKKLAVIGPLADVVYRDWYTGTPAYRITPLDGIVSKVSPEAVTYRDGLDRVVIKSSGNGMYIGTKNYNDGSLSANRSMPVTSVQFKHTDWGWGSHTLQAVANGKFITTDDQTVGANANEVWGWFVKELFHFVPQEDGTNAWQTWNGRTVCASEDGNHALLVKDKPSGSKWETFGIETVTDGTAQAVEAARKADTAIVFVGNHPLINGKEEIDRPDLTLPDAQVRLIREVHKANPNTIVVIVGSYPYALGDLADQIPAILYTAHGGQELGNAVADVLFGDYNPAGRLNMTWYQSVDQLPDMMEYDIMKGKRTYQYFDGEPLYPFGYGLSYTTFKYNRLEVSADEIDENGSLLLTVEVENTGSTAGDEVVQLYARCNSDRIRRPQKELKGFKRIHLAPGGKQTVNFELPASELSFWDVSRDRYAVEPGDYTVMIGRSSADLALSAAFRIKGEPIPPRNLTQVTRAENYDDYEGVKLDESKEGGTCVSEIESGDWVSFHNVRFESSADSFEARISDAEAGSTIEIRLGSPEGTLAGTCPISAANKPGVWQTETCGISLQPGSHDIYLVFRGSLKLSWFRFVKA